MGAALPSNSTRVSPALVGNWPSVYCAAANVAGPKVRATAFALNILIIHLFGDALSPPLLGLIAGRSNMNVAFLVISVTMLLSGIIWLFGMKYLAADTAAVENQPAT